MKCFDMDFPDEIKKLFAADLENAGQIYDYEAKLCEFFSKNYLKFTSSPNLFKTRTNEFRIIRSLRPEHLRPNQYNKGLEVGCSFGFKTLLLRPFCKSLIGVDIPEKYFEDIHSDFDTSVDFAKYIINDILGIKNISFVTSYLDNLYIENNSIDFIYSEYVLEHVPDYRLAVSEFYRVMKRDAVMMHTVPITLCHILPFFEKNLNSTFGGTFKSFSRKVRHFLRRRKGHYESSDLTWNFMHIPASHSEYLSTYDFMAQLNVYLLESYLFPMVEMGFEILDILQTREHNRVIIARKVN